MTRIFRSSAFRTALAFAFAVTATTYVVFALVYYRLYADNVSLVRSVLQDEAQKTRDTPVDALKRRLELRLTQDLRHLDYVGLYDKDGRKIFGNVSTSLDVPIDGKSHLVRTPPPQQEAWQSENAIVVAEPRSDGGKLVLGRSLVYVDQLEAAMLHTFLAAIIPVIVLALVIGTIVSLRASRRLTTIQDAIIRVMQGDLDVRLPARGTSDDIDELVRAVNRMLDEIVRLLHQISSVGENIAHDLRSPLAALRSRLDRGLSNACDQDLRPLVVTALGDLDRALTTVSALLRISELEGGLRRSAFATVDLAEICRDVLDLYEPLGEAKGLTMTLAASAPITISGDGDLLREAFANLIDNAIKFTPEGGRVFVACGTQDALVRVRDTGPGIALDEREKILKRFYRSKATRDTPGIGLGLSMATTIIELHGLALRVGANDPGAVFDVILGVSGSAGGGGRSSFREQLPTPILKRNLIGGLGRTS